MPSPSLIEAFHGASERHAAAVADLVPLLVEMALTSVAEVLPGAEVIETEAEMNEDWLFTLRARRVLDRNGKSLYETAEGHDDASVEEAIDRVGFDYLDPLLDLTGDEYLGNKTIQRTAGGTS